MVKIIYLVQESGAVRSLRWLLSSEHLESFIILFLAPRLRRLSWGPAPLAAQVSVSFSVCPSKGSLHMVALGWLDFLHSAEDAWSSCSKTAQQRLHEVSLPLCPILPCSQKASHPFAKGRDLNVS